MKLTFPEQVEVLLWRGSVLGTLVFGELVLFKEIYTNIPFISRNDPKTWKLATFFIFNVICHVGIIFPLFACS